MTGPSTLRKVLVFGILSLGLYLEFTPFAPTQCFGQSRTGIELKGNANGDECGAAIVNIGDVSGDGIDDIAVGCPDAAPGGLSGGGLVKVFSGASGSFLYDVLPSAGGHQLGTSLLALLRDVNGDSVPDFIAGAPRANNTGNNSGQILVISGANGFIIATIGGPFAEMRFGERLAGPVSLNPLVDSVTDILVGAPNYDPGGADRSGAVYALDGTTLSVSTPLFVSVGKNAFDTFGKAIEIINDRNQDGVPEFAVGAPGYDIVGSSGVGAVSIHDGSNGTELSQYEGTQAGDSMGFSIAYLGDLNNDSFDDYAVGSPAATRSINFEGYVAVISGADDLTELYSMAGEGAFHDFGFSLERVGDLDGDSYPDLLVGDPEADFSATLNDPGSVYLLSGASGAVIYRLDGLSTNASFGTSVVNLGNIDGDLYDEFAIGEINKDEGVVHLRWHQRPSLEVVGTGTIGTLVSLPIVTHAGLDLWFLWDFDPGPIISPCGRFDIGFSPLWGFASGLPTDGNGQLTLSATIPNDPGLIGITLYMQTLTLTPIAPNGKYMLSLGNSVTFN